jgi:hypothetical protein
MGNNESLTLADLLPMLKNVRKQGSGFTALCPAHDDHRNSLSIGEKSGRILIHCHANCDFNEICNSLGIHPSQLFSDTFSNHGISNEVERSYDYQDENGDLSFQIVRMPGKRFFNRKPLPNGDWENNLTGVTRVLYKLPRLFAAQRSADKDQIIVYICEGEKDVETLEKHGFLATCNPHGAGKWRDDYSESLTGLPCVILPDNDDTGRKHAQQVANSIFGKAASVKVVELPGLPEKGDVSDWLRAGNTPDELKTIISESPLWLPSNQPVPSIHSHGFNFSTLDELLNEPEEEISFVWDMTLPAGGFSICSAKPKVGKSTVARNLAVCVSRGAPFLGRDTLQGKVLYLCLEEKRAEIAKQFRKMGISGNNILIYTGATPKNALDELAKEIAEHEPLLVIIDPLSRVLRVGDFNDYASMAHNLEPFIDLARKFKVHIMALHHDSKAQRDGGDALLGSTALFGAVDTLIQMKKRTLGRTIMSTQRYGEDIPETVIELDKETATITAEGDLESIVQKEKQDEILNCFGNGEELTEADIKERVGGSSKGQISKAIRVLESEGKLLRSGGGKKGNPYRFMKPQTGEETQSLLDY